MTDSSEGAQESMNESRTSSPARTGLAQPRSLTVRRQLLHLSSVYQGSSGALRLPLLTASWNRQQAARAIDFMPADCSPMTDLNKLSPEALKAAMMGGTEEWGSWGSAQHHELYVQVNKAMSRRKCHCGCGGRKTHGAFANGIILSGGCELSMRRWAKEMNAAKRT
jgi:hypothetical protein